VKLKKQLNNDIIFKVEVKSKRRNNE